MITDVCRFFDLFHFGLNYMLHFKTVNITNLMSAFDGTIITIWLSIVFIKSFYVQLHPCRAPACVEGGGQDTLHYAPIGEIKGVHIIAQ